MVRLFPVISYLVNFTSTTKYWLNNDPFMLIPFQVSNCLTFNNWHMIQMLDATLLLSTLRCITIDEKEGWEICLYNVFIP